MKKRFYLSVSFSPSPMLAQIKNLKLISDEDTVESRDLILYLTPLFEAPLSEMDQIRETVKEISGDHFFENLNMSFAHLLNLSVRPSQGDYFLSLKASLSSDLEYFVEDVLGYLKNFTLIKKGSYLSLNLGRFNYTPVLNEKIHIIKELLDSYNSLEVKEINFHQQKFEKNYQVLPILDMNQSPNQFSHQQHRFKVI